VNVPFSSPTFVGGGVLAGNNFTVVRWYRSVVSICISYLARDVEHFFMCFLVIWTSSFEKVLFGSVAHFFICSLILREFSFLSFLYILVISPLSDE
jgi:hypothetical protein